MKPQIIDGKLMAQELRHEIKREVELLGKGSGVVPGLAAVLVGEDPASRIYVRNKIRACTEAGIFSEAFYLNETIEQSELVLLLEQLNNDSKFHGILVQLPLPKHLNEQAVISTLEPNKDVDGLHPLNTGRLAQGRPRYIPATPAGIQEMLVRSGNLPHGKHVVVCGRSNIVGTPLALLLSQKNHSANATVSICHTGTVDLGCMTKQADILVAAMGKPMSITPDMVKPGAVVIDVGTNRIPDTSIERGYRLVGDVDFAGVFELTKAITPVPGGVGPMTIAMLLKNTLLAAQYNAGLI